MSRCRGVSRLRWQAAAAATWSLLISRRLPDRRTTWADLLPGCALFGTGLDVLHAASRGLPAPHAVAVFCSGPASTCARGGSTSASSALTSKDATHWSRASMAAEAGLSRSTIGRIWREFRLKPHLADTFKLSSDPLFIEKVRDVVGLYLDPPERALVLCVDEKSGIQALDRSAPVLPMMPGMPERRTHDYVRAGTTTLFAALDVGSGQVIGSLHRRHRAVEFRKFLTKIDAEVPANLDVHLICDNLSTHKTPAIARWLDTHPRFHLHFTPTSSSWLNQVERWFALLTDKQLRRGVHKSLHALEKDIRSWVTTWNENPRPFAWTKTAHEIFERLNSYLQRTPGAGQ